MDLDLTLKPSKCISIVYDGKKMDKTVTFAVGSGSSRSISLGPTKFLGQLQSSSIRSNSREEGGKYKALFNQNLEILDQTHIRGEFKLWIYKRYLCPSFNFSMAVDSIPEAAIKKMQGVSLRKIKHWLNLPRCFTTSALHHPNIIDIPALSDLHTKAKITLLSSISTSKDSFIQEIVPILTDEQYCKSQKIDLTIVELVHKARSSVSTISSKSLSTYCRRDLRKLSIDRHDSKFKTLTVQRKVLEVAELESSNQVWKRIMAGLPAGQFSLLLRAGTDTLPTPLNLKRWRYRTDPSCPLFGHKQPTVHHILSNCQIALEQGRFTWRHDSALKYLVEGLRDYLEDNVILYADLPNMRASDNPIATIPESTLITSARPDIVLVGHDEITLLELTIPHNSMESISNARARKSTKANYLQTLSDLERKGFKPYLLTIEIGSLGHWTQDSQRSLIKAAPSMSKHSARMIMDQVATKVIRASQIIFNARVEESWSLSRTLL